MAVWFARTGGANTNSGGGDTNAPDINGEAGTDFVVAGGTGLTYAPGGFNALPADSIGPTGYTRSVNLNIAGVRTVRKLTVTGDTTGTLDAAVANGSYGGSVGGARVLINNLVGVAAGENPRLAATDFIYLQPLATFTETSIVFDAGARMDMRGATIDGTGGGAGTDILGTGIAISPKVYNGVLANAVSDGFNSNQGGAFFGVRAQAAGAIGISCPGVRAFCAARSCGSHGFSDSNNSELVAYCEAGDNTGVGINFARGGRVVGCLVYDSGAAAGGIVFNNDVGADNYVLGSTSEGNTGPGVSFTGTGGGVIELTNCALTNNGTYGASAATDRTAFIVLFDFNLFFGNGTAARNNLPAGANDLTSDPEYIAAASDDYTPGPGSPLLNAGYNPTKASAAPTIGAVGADAVASADFPDEADVRAGVVYADGTMEGELTVGGGGSGIFPSQMRGGPGSRT
ncbi:MAG TPA: right-handed parallel beta-helix repeat-containing protein [Planctomycetota bacterium]|nr:right-handed parallel beta-helix repeat-containing protein [Planctomycetota bacterium]